MNKKGFTLTEILVVLIIAGILMALILPNALKAITKADDTAHDANMNNINAAIMVCYAQNRNDTANPGWAQCDTIDELKNGGFLKDIPTHPNYTYTVGPDTVTTGYIAVGTAK
jgi:prepilin-type N-terminal cleavage/methylation domain-containing protein